MNITQLLQACRDEKITIVTAESCTAGMVAASITGAPGASDVYERGFISYSNESKYEMLGVAEKLIQTHGAVSEQVSKAMAEGALKHSKANLAIAVTGVAGPDGGTEEKPVGLVYICLCGKEETSDARRFRFEGTRTDIREQISEQALELLEDYLQRRARSK